MHLKYCMFLCKAVLVYIYEKVGRTIKKVLQNLDSRKTNHAGPLSWKKILHGNIGTASGPSNGPPLRHNY